MINLIVAIDENGAIGRQGDLLCHMSADLRHFKDLTMGHPIIMGSKTYLSFPRRPLPGRENIVITRDSNKHLEGATMVGSLEEALRVAGIDNEPFVIGGGSIYALAMQQNVVDRLYITHIHHHFEDADTFFPAIDPTLWQAVFTESHPADDKNPYPYTYITYQRKS